MKKEEVLEAYFAGELDEAATSSFCDELRSDPDYREEFARQCALHGLLGLAMEDEKSGDQWKKDVIDSLRRDDREEFVGGVRRKLVRFRQVELTRRVAALAACLLVSVGLAFWFWGEGAAEEEGAVVARIVETSGLSGGGLEKGRLVRAGDEISFESGLVELEMEGRGRMVIEGPVEIEFADAKTAKISEGRAFMKVTPAGHGYRLETPRGDVVDLGTEFGVVVDKESSSVETHVIDGEVCALPDDGEAVMLRKDEGIRMKKGSSERIHSDGGAFYSSLPPESPSDFPMVHWSFDERKDGRYQGMASGVGQESYPMKLLGEPRQPAEIDGPFGQALSFSGDGDFAESTFPGVEGRKPRTVAFWVKVPKDFDPDEGYACVSWGRFGYERFGQVWQVSVNPGFPSDGGGPVGRLRLGVYGGFAIGTTDLRDEEWHHVAIVLYEAGRPDVGKHVIMYVDGKMEPISTRLLGEIRTVPGNDGHGVLLGRDITSLNRIRDGKEWGFFRGGLDELHIFEGALSQTQIQSLMERNELPKK